jgi:hypothetical protein
MAITARQSLAFRDLRGHVGKVGFWYTYNSATAANLGAASTQIAAINTAIVALTNAQVVAVNGLAGNRLDPVHYGSNGVYANAETKAKLSFLAFAAGGVHSSFVRLEIPAPVVAMFLADKETVDPANAAVATLFSALSTSDAQGGFASDKMGNPITYFLGGTLVRRPFQRKITIYDLSADLGEPEE